LYRAQPDDDPHCRGRPFDVVDVLTETGRNRNREKKKKKKKERERERERETETEREREKEREKGKAKERRKSNTENSQQTHNTTPQALTIESGGGRAPPRLSLY
jgi:hypothetical protein